MFRPLSLTLAGVAASLAAAPAMAEPDPAIATYLAAFNDTCRRGFPDLDAIAAHAQAIGWVSSEIRLIAGAGMPPVRAFRKDGLMLFLNLPTEGASRAVCQIGGGTAGTKATSADVAAVLTPSLKAGEPSFVTDKGKDVAVWQVAPGIHVDGGISIYNRKVRSISLSVHQAR